MDSSPEIPPAIDRETIAAAQRRIAADVRRTPLWRLPGAALGLDVAELWLKLEQLQLGGSFKARGMFNRMRSLPIPAAGVVIASGGNAGIAVATAARTLGVPCENSPATPSGRRWPTWGRRWSCRVPPMPTHWPPACSASSRPARC